MASSTVRVSRVATPASLRLRAPSPESTASRPATADRTASGSVRSALNTSSRIARHGQPRGIPHDRRDLVTRRQGLPDDLPADAAGGAENREFHGVLPYL